MTTANYDTPFAKPYPQYMIEEGQVRSHGLISIAPTTTQVLIPSNTFKKVLRLTFDDVPHATFQKGNITYRGPSKEEVIEAIAFAEGCLKDDETSDLTIHCQAGKSRSAALALIINIHVAIQKSGYDKTTKPNKDIQGRGGNRWSKTSSKPPNDELKKKIVEQEIQRLLSIDTNTQFCFNPRIIKIGEELLGTPIDPELSNHCKPYVGWKKYWSK
jgi:predicted protein tyrosine phosphatase